MKKMNDNELILRAKNKDEEAFNCLYTKYYKSLLYTAYRLTNNEADAQDAVQLAFIQMQSSIQDLRDPKYFRLWMNKIVRGKCIDIFNKNKDVYADIESSEWTNTYIEKKEDYLPNEHFKFIADKDILMNLIQTLPSIYREVLVLRYFSQFSMEEMADILNVPSGTVKSRLHVAKKELRKAVNAYEKMNAYKLTFHIPGAMQLALLLSFHSAFAFCSHKRFHAPNFAQCMLGATAVCSSIAGVYAYQAFLPEKTENQITPQPLLKTVQIPQEDREQYAYFKLMDWAFDETQMEEKSQEEVQEIRKYYELLKNKQGPYWEQLQKNAWSIAYENLNK